MEYKNLSVFIKPPMHPATVKTKLDAAMDLLRADKYEVFAVTAVPVGDNETAIVVSGKRPVSPQPRNSGSVS